MATIQISRSDIDMIKVDYPTTTVAELLYHYNINPSSANTVKLGDISLDDLWHLIGVELGCIPPSQPTGTDEQAENATQQPVNNMTDQRDTQSTPTDLAAAPSAQPTSVRKQRGPGKSVVQSTSRPHLQAHEHHLDLQLCTSKTLTELADPAIVDWLLTPHNGIHIDQLFGAPALLLSLHETFPALVYKINAKLHAEGDSTSDLTAESKTLNKRVQAALQHLFGKSSYAQRQKEFRKARMDRMGALKGQYVQLLMSTTTYNINPVAACECCKVKEMPAAESDDSENEGEAKTPPATRKRKYSDDDPATTASKSQSKSNPAKRATSEQAFPGSFLDMFIPQFVGPVQYEPIASYEPGYGEGFNEGQGL